MEEGLQIWDATENAIVESQPFILLGAANGPGLTYVNGSFFTIIETFITYISAGKALTPFCILLQKFHAWALVSAMHSGLWRKQ